MHKKAVATHKIVINGYKYGSVTFETLFAQISIERNATRTSSQCKKKSKIKQNPKAKDKSNLLFPNSNFKLFFLLYRNVKGSVHVIHVSCDLISVIVGLFLFMCGFCILFFIFFSKFFLFG